MVLHETLVVLVLQCYGRRRRDRIGTIEMNNLIDLLGIRRMDIVPNSQIRELCRVTKAFMKVFSGGSAIWKGWKMIGLLKEYVGECAGSC